MLSNLWSGLHRYSNNFFFLVRCFGQGESSGGKCVRKGNISTFFLLCLPALSGQKCWQTYMHGQQTKNYRLEGFQLKALHTRTLFTCFQICLKLDTCESLNFATDSGVCELNRKRVSISGYLIYRPGYIFVQALFEKGVSQILFFFFSLVMCACWWFLFSLIYSL